MYHTCCKVSTPGRRRSEDPTKVETRPVAPLYTFDRLGSGSGSGRGGAFSPGSFGPHPSFSCVRILSAHLSTRPTMVGPRREILRFSKLKTLILSKAYCSLQGFFSEAEPPLQSDTFGPRLLTVA
eukprot:6666619-Prymnesium_polylepis.1